MFHGFQALFFFMTLSFFLPAYAFDSGIAENQIEICEADLQRVLGALGVSSDPDKERWTGFFDTADLDLFQRKFYVRVRHSGKKVKVTFKRNEPTQQIWNDPGVECETDVHVDYTKRSCAYDTDLSAAQFEKLKKSPQDWRHIFSAEAVSAYLLLSDDFSDFGRIRFLGEVLNHKWGISTSGGTLDLDVWFMPPDQKPMMEVSLRSNVQDYPQVFPKISRDLESKGLSLCKQSQNRTNTLLKYLTSQP